MPDFRIIQDILAATVYTISVLELIFNTDPNLKSLRCSRHNKALKHIFKYVGSALEVSRDSSSKCF